MSNSQTYLLEQILLLSLENTRLSQQLSHCKQSSFSERTNCTLARIEEIELKMQSQIAVKENKIAELNSHIRQLYSNNTDILQKYQVLTRNYENLEQSYVKEVSDLKAELLESKSARFQESYQQSQYHFKLVEKEKEFLEQQLEKLKRVTIKQMEADMDLLRRENQNYISSITMYRQEVNTLKADREVNQQTIKRLENSILLLKQQFLSEKETLMKQATQQLDTKRAEFERSLEKVKQEKKTLIRDFQDQLRKKESSLQKRKSKLREYDTEYDNYVNKMNAINQDLAKLREQNRKLRDTIDNISANAAKQSSEKEITFKIATQKLKNTINGMEKDRIEAEQKGKQDIDKVRKQIGMMEKQVKELREQITKEKLDKENKVNEAEKQRKQAISQWEELMAEMQKQKTIIRSLEKQLDHYRTLPSLKIDVSHQTNNNQTPVAKIELNNSTHSHDISNMLLTSYHEQYQELQGTRQASNKSASTKKAIIKQETFKTEQIVENNIDEIHAAYAETKMKEKTLNKYYSSGTLPPDPTCCQDCSASKPQNPRVRGHSQGSFKKIKTEQESYSTNQCLETIRCSLRRRDLDEAKKSKYSYLPQDQNILIVDTQGDEEQGRREFFGSSNRQETIYDYEYPSRTTLMSRNSDSRPVLGEARMSASLSQQSSVARSNMFDSKASEIQKYLSFELKPSSSTSQFSRSSSQQKLHSDSNQPSSTNSTNRLGSTRQIRFDSQPIFMQEHSSKQALMDKMSRLNSWREQGSRGKQTSNVYTKRTPQLILQRDKENLNEIIHKKCLYMAQK